MKKIVKKIANKEVLSYGFWGVTTTLVNIIIYSVLCIFIDYKIANLIAIIVGKTYAYFVNKFFVFKSHCKNVKELMKEIGSFAVTRGFSGVVDYFGVLFCVEILRIDKQISKYLVTAIVMIMNYIFGKFVVFSKKKE